MTEPMAAADESSKPLRVTCPRCGKKTSCIQSYDIPIVVFILLYTAWTYERVFGCPRCVRSTIFKRMLLSIPLTNLFCWIAVPWHLLYIVSSLATERPGIPPEYAGLAVFEPKP